MKSRLWAGVALVGLLSFAPFAFGRSAGSGKALGVISPLGAPANLLAAFFGPRGGSNSSAPTHNYGNGGNGGGGWGGGGNGCGQGGNGGNGGNGGWGGNGGNGNGGWGGNGGGGNGGCVPEGGNSLEYLGLGALACIGAVVYRTRRQSADCVTR